MIHAENFKTKTLLVERENPGRGDSWNVGLDIGYSGVKGFSPNSVYCFPAFAKKVPENMMSLAKPKNTDIQYRNIVNGDIWDVGEGAQALSNTNDSELAVFGRTRYFSEMFLVLAEVGIAFGLLNNRYGSIGDKKLYVQTGLPPAYREMDTSLLIEALSGHHDFELKIGDRDWKRFTFDLDENSIGVMDQPLGTLYSISTGANGRPVKDAPKYFDSSLLILDAGFGTLDIFNLEDGKLITNPETIDNMGMKQIFKNTIRDIAKEYRKEVTITGMQKVLATGKIKAFNKKERRSFEVNISDILDRNCRKICSEALSHIYNTYNDLSDHDYLVITGGTGSAWKSMICEELKHMNETLTILSGAQNDNLSPVFANVRGYYMYALNRR